MKYKLINIKTKEEHLCDKVTIEGFDYYVTDGKIHYGYVWNTILEQVETMFKEKPFHDDLKGIIATNNSNIDIPKVVDEVEDFINEIHAGQGDYHEAGQIIGRRDGYNKAKEKFQFTEEDMIDFYEWCDTSEEAAIFWRRNRVDLDMSGNHWKKIRENRKKLLQFWREQQPKKVYYE